MESTKREETLTDRSFKTWLLATAVTSSLLIVDEAVAQEAVSHPTNLQEVIVTARKREESLQKVPVVINVITQSVLEKTKVDDLFGLTARVPGLLMGSGVTSVGTQLS